VKVANPSKIHYVLIFLRLKSTDTEETTKWGGGANMIGNSTGTFTYNLTPANFEHYREYANAWGQYQFVALNASKQRVGASGQYLRMLTIAPCP